MARQSRQISLEWDGVAPGQRRLRVGAANAPWCELD